MNRSEISTYLLSLGDFALLNEHPLFLACLDEALALPVTKGGVARNYTPREVLRDAAGNCRGLLCSTQSTVGLTFRGVRVNRYLADREELLHQLDQLIAQCSD